ncbi:hypothetical protein BGX27_008545 [Mortierella sp. AM989]|nr:hypothetical protein BGX27_008545 [Mortierella sp. AM989]
MHEIFSEKADSSEDVPTSSRSSTTAIDWTGNNRKSGGNRQDSDSRRRSYDTVSTTGRVAVEKVGSRAVDPEDPNPPKGVDPELDDPIVMESGARGYLVVFGGFLLYLTQGILFGVGASFLNLAATAIPPLWYDVHRGLAMGICFCGAGIGGLVLGFVIPALINKVDVWWTLRIYALIYLVLTAFAALVMRAPKQLSGPTLPPHKEVLRISIMKNPRFLLWFAASAFFGFAYVIPFTYLPSYAHDVIGLDPNVQGGHLISIMSAANAVGRIVIGFVGDRLGAYPVAMVSFLIAPLSCLLWMFAHSQGVLIAFSIIYGFFCGAWFTLVASITSHLVDLESLGSGLAMVFLINTPGNLFTLPIAGDIIDNSGYKSMIGFDMAMWFCTALFMFILISYDIILAHIKKSRSKQ